MPRDCALSLFLPLIHDTLCFSFKFCKTPHKDRLFPLVHLPMKVFALFFCYVSWSNVVCLRRSVTTWLGLAKTCSDLDFHVPSLMFLSCNQTGICFSKERYSSYWYHLYVFVYWFSNLSVHKYNSEELI